jgi:hypothetical protein
MIFLSCQDIAGITPSGCCNSCHDDADEGYESLMEKYMTGEDGEDGEEVILMHCCHYYNVAINLTAEDWRAMLINLGKRMVENS